MDIRKESRDNPGSDNTAQKSGNPGKDQVPPISSRYAYEAVRITPEEEAARKKKMRRERAAAFRTYALPSLIFALTFTVCAWRNEAGVFYVVLMAAALILNRRVFHRGAPAPEAVSSEEPQSSSGEADVREKGAPAEAGSRHPFLRIFYPAALMLLAVSVCTTASSELQLMDWFGILLLGADYMIFCSNPGAGTGIFRRLAGIVKVLFLPLVHFPEPVSDLAAGAGERRERNGSHENRRAALLGVLIAVVLLMVVLPLLASSDAVFRHLTSGFLDFFRFFHLTDSMITVPLTFLFGYWCCYCIWKTLTKEKMEIPASAGGHSNPVTAVTFLVPLTAVYVLFSVIQLVYVVGRRTLPDGYGYAGYVHEGFYQLCAVSLLNIILVMICRSVFRSRRVLSGLMLAVCACTFVMTLSAALRMRLYVEACGLTFLRLCALWFMVVLTVWTTLLVLLILKPEFPAGRAMIVSFTMLYLAFALVHPDYRIAKYNMAHMRNDSVTEADTQDDAYLWDESLTPEEKEREKKIRLRYRDAEYLLSLSDDAAPALAEDPDLIAVWAAERRKYSAEGPEEGSTVSGSGNLWNRIRTYNFSEAAAERIADEALKSTGSGRIT